MLFFESANIVEILREAGPAGLHVKDIAAQATEVLRAKKPDAAELDASRISTCIRSWSLARSESIDIAF